MTRVIAMLALAAALWPLPAIAVEDLETGRTIARIPLRPGEEVVLRYRHSLYGGQVWEHLSVRPDGLVLTALEAEREAALEYYGLAGQISRRGGRAFLTGLHVPVGAPVVRATALGARTLVVGSRAIPLAAGREGHRIRLRPAFEPLGRVAGETWQRLRPWP